MSQVERYRLWYEHEKWCNAKMLEMISSVPEGARHDDRFQRSLVLAGHLATCRENWLDRMIHDGKTQAPWWPEADDLEALRLRFEKIEAKWTEYLGGLTEEQLTVDFEFPFNDEAGYRWNIEGQIVQLVGHAFYHRGQIAMIVADLGGSPADTDYLYWSFGKQPDRWKKIDFYPVGEGSKST